MFQSLQALASAAVMERATLLINHILKSESVAVERLQAHIGRVIHLSFDGWPAWLPPLPSTAFRVTPAGLIEWCGDEVPAEPELLVSIDVSNPALAVVRAATGERPRVEVAGDAAFAADVNWLFDNLRWDLQDDLAQLVGPGPARELGRLGGFIAKGLGEAVRLMGDWATGGRGGSSGQARR